EIYTRMWLHPLFRLMRVIPVSSSDPPRQVIESIKEARLALDDGYLVCIFAEGAITRNGNIRSFKPGLERIVKGTDHPIIPVHIGGAWGSIFSYYEGRLLGRWPRRIPYRVSVFFGAPMLSASSTHEVRMAVQELSVREFDIRRSSDRCLSAMFIRTARSRWFSPAIADTTGKRLSFGRALAASIILSQKIKALSEKSDTIGVMLPATVGGALTNIAISLLGRVAVNLNFTASSGVVTSAIRQCRIATVVSSRAFVKKLNNFNVPEGTVFIEDILSDVSLSDKISGLLKALFAPRSVIMHGRGPAPDDTATIVFSSGSTGDPKGVMLTHHNIISNIEAFCMVFRLSRKDRMCGVLPFFHSFGYTVTLWAPLLLGFSVYYHPNPTEAAKVGSVVRENELTVLLATPTFLLTYLRRLHKDDFQSLRAVVVGAEKLKVKIADAFEEQFGFRPLEGYGATELSPVVSLNIPDVKIDGVAQVGNKAGSVGHPLPGITAQVVDPDSGVSLSLGEEGVLMVKGPNVMKGYLGMPEKTAEVLQRGWYNTGDIAKIDEDGFIFLMDRMSRYSKIGGEMVPHIAIEDRFIEALGAVNQVVFVTAAPDDKKGEQLVVLHTLEAGSADDLNKIIQQSDIPNLWKPRRENYLQVDSIPMLGSGKFDLKKMKELAREFVDDRPTVVERMIQRIRKFL
ncbi:MAG: AMP-binding protein, partial [Lentisphaerae bacterium]|nr:AMP-binding protein [Lentisphaerota bacterium]